jgi:hypothetical protein
MDYLKNNNYERKTKQKTPIQEIQAKMNELGELHFCDWLGGNIQHLLEKEKDVMCEFAEKYADYSWNISNQNRYMAPMSAEEYFNETLNTKENE